MAFNNLHLNILEKMNISSSQTNSDVSYSMWISELMIYVYSMKVV